MATIGNIGIFGTKTRTNTLLAIYLLGETHASELARLLGKSLSRIQDAIDSLEKAGVVVGIVEGGARRVRINSRFFAKDELNKLLQALSSSEPTLLKSLSERRRRPRRASKQI